MLVGIYLSDVPNPYAGNFTVWSGTHRAFERYFRQHGAEALLDGMPPIDLPRPRQITGAAGDIILAHYQIAHTAAPNVSPHTRYAVFFRMRHVDHPSFRPEAMTDIWLNGKGCGIPRNQQALEALKFLKFLQVDPRTLMSILRGN